MKKVRCIRLGIGGIEAGGMAPGQKLGYGPMAVMHIHRHVQGNRGTAGVHGAVHDDAHFGKQGRQVA